jgi:outer membrane protein
MLRLRLIAATIISASLPLIAGAQDSLPRAINMQEAIALARRNAPQIVEAQGQVRTSGAAVRSAYAAFIPSIGVSLDGTRSTPSRVPQNPWTFSTGISADVTLFAGGQRLFDLSAAKARAVAAGANATIQQYAVTFNVKQEYFNVLAAHESEAAALAQLEQANHQLRLSTAQLRAGIVTRSDSLRAEIQVRNASLALLEARSSIAVASASLTRIVGTPYPVTAAADDTTADSGFSLTDDEIRRLAEVGPAVSEADLSLRAARAARKSAWTAYLPSVTMGYSKSGSSAHGSFSPFTGYEGGEALQLSMSLPIFNQYLREGQITGASVAEENASALLRDAILAAREGVTQGLASYRTASERVQTQVATVAAAEEDLRLQQQRYNLGGSTLLDVLTSQTQLDQARSDLIRARYDRRVAKAQLESLLGRDF